MQEATNMRTNEGNISRIQAQLKKYFQDKRILEKELNTLRREFELLRVGSRVTVRASGVCIEEVSSQTQSKIDINVELFNTFDEGQL